MIAQMILDSIGKQHTPEIVATFRDGRMAVYSAAVLGMMIDDSDVIEIMDVETGELYK